MISIFSKDTSTTVKKWIKSADGISFLSAFFVGFIVHLYIYTNLYLSHDASSVHQYSPEWDIVTGRYVGTLIKQLHGSLQTPVMIGFITMIFLSLSSLFINKALQIKKPIFLILISILIVTWPTITAMNAYLYMASQFGFAIFSACLAAYVTERYRYGFAMGIPLLCISMACYQAYWGTCATIMLLCIFRDVFNHQASTQKIVFKCIRFTVTLGLGILLYYGLWIYFMKVHHLAMTNYLGMDTMGYASFAEFFTALRNTYGTVFAFFFKPNTQSYYPVHIMVAGWASISLMLALTIVFALQQKIYLQPLRCVILIVSCILFPMAINCGEIFSKSVTTPTALMRFAFMAPFLLLILVVSMLEERSQKTFPFQLVSSISVAIIALHCINGFYGANATYLKIESNYHIALSTTTQWLTRIQAEPAYKADTPVAIVGQPKLLHRSGFDWCEDIPGANNTALTYDRPIRRFIKMIHPEMNLLYDSSPYEKLESVQALQSFPSNHCIVWIDGTLIIKLSEYTIR